MSNPVPRHRYERDILIAARLGMGWSYDKATEGLCDTHGPAARIATYVKKHHSQFGNPAKRNGGDGYWNNADADVKAPASLDTPEDRVWSYISNCPSPHTRRAYASALRQAVDFLGLDALGDLLAIDTGQVMRYYETLKAKGYAPGTIRRQLTVLRHLLTREIRLGHRPAPNPADPLLVKPPKGEARSQLDVLTPDEVQQLLRPCDEGTRLQDVRDAALLRIMFWCGLRVGEVAGMTAAEPEDWAHRREGAHFARNGASVMLRVCGKGEKARTMPVSDELAGKVAAYLEATGRDWTDTAPLWKAVKSSVPEGERVCEGMQTRSIRRLLQIRCRQAGIDKHISAHSTRKTAATRLLNLGVDLERIRQFLGHSSLDVTQKYLRVGDDMDNHAARRMAY